MTDATNTTVSVKARPILFSGPMVRALLDGRKSQTRRAVKLPHENRLGVWEASILGGPGTTLRDGTPVPAHPVLAHSRTGDCIGCPYGFAGDLLFAREAFTIVPASAYRMSEGVQQTVNPNDRDMAAIYAAGWDRSIPKWRPSIHMPRWASRLTLEIVDVRVERLKSISDADAVAEGLLAGDEHSEFAGMWTGGADGCGWFADPRRAYLDLWEAINGRASTIADPWTWVVEFSTHKANVDAVLTQHGGPAVG